MNITFFIGGISGGGAERAVCNLSNYMEDKGNECAVLTMSEDRNAYGLKDKVKVEVLIKDHEKKNKIFDNIVRLFRLLKYIRKKKCDVYIVFLPITIIMFLMFKNFTKAKVIVSERADPSRYHPVIQFLLKKLAYKADVWVFQTEDAKAWYGDSVKRAIVIPNAINEEFIRDSYKGERRKVIVGAGRLNEQKDFELLINAFADISHNYPEYDLEIYGEGIQRNNLEKLVKNCGVANKVKMPGYVSSLGDKIRDASIFVLSSNFEGMPNALMEAMALGLTCISTDCPVGGPRSLIKTGENGIIIPVNDIEKLKDALKYVIENSEVAKDLGKSAELIKNKLSPQKIYGEWLQICYSLM